MDSKSLLQRSAQTSIETSSGYFDIIVYRETYSQNEHVALITDWHDRVPLVRIHSKCLTGDTFGSKYCDCQQQLHSSLEQVQKHGGIVIYLDQEGRGVGLTNKIQAYELQRNGMDTVEANVELGRAPDERSYELAVEILNDLAVESLRLLTNNPLKEKSLIDAGFQVERVPLHIDLSSERGRRYLETKRKKLGHL